MSLTFKVGIDPQEHDTFVKASPLCTLLQSSNWAKVKNNWDHQLAGAYRDGSLVASSLVLIKRLPLGFAMWYTPRGPIMDYQDGEVVAFFFKELRRYAKSQKALFIKFDPPIHYNDYPVAQQHQDHHDVTKEMTNIQKTGAQHLGFNTQMDVTIQPRYQANIYAVSDYGKTLPKHTKKYAKMALKKDVKISRVGIDRVEDFAKVVAATEARKGISLRNENYFRQLMETYGEDAWLYLAEIDVPTTLARLAQEDAENEQEIAATPENARKKLHRLQEKKASIAIARKEMQELQAHYPKKTVIAGTLTIGFGDTMEMLYAGMDEEFKRFYPQYGLYVATMEDAFAAGAAYVNLGGVEGSLDDGLTKFKDNFNPIINEFVGEFNLPVNGLLYPLANYFYEKRKAKD